MRTKRRVRNRKKSAIEVPRLSRPRGGDEPVTKYLNSEGEKLIKRKRGKKKSV